VFNDCKVIFLVQTHIHQREKEENRERMQQLAVLIAEAERKVAVNKTDYTRVMHEFQIQRHKPLVVGINQHDGTPVSTDGIDPREFGPHGSILFPDGNGNRIRLFPEHGPEPGVTRYFS
jgi:hypothetical protein